VLFHLRLQPTAYRLLDHRHFSRFACPSRLSRKRVNNILACLGKILRYAHEAEVIASVPKIKLLKVPPPKFDFLTFEELERLLDAVKGDPERRTLFLALAGPRQERQAR
jgi:hypothetical protein